jgi:branched-chain amino acid aminotransferase
MSQLTPTEWIWRDGAFVPWGDATLHLLSHSVQFGSAAFEGIRCYPTAEGPAIFRLREHLQRLITSVRIYRVELPYTLDELVDACVQTVVRNGLERCYIRPMVVHGFGAAGMVPAGSPLHVFVPCWPWGAYLGADASERGIAACVSSWQRVAPNTIPAMAKVAGNYLSGQLIKLEALANGYDEAIALSPGGTVSEGSGQNVFAVVDGVLHTTPLDGTILGGITRATIMTLAREAGYVVREQMIARETLYGADEVFLCGTATEVAPVTSLDRIRIGSGTPGPITRYLRDRYLDVVHGRVPDAHGWLTRVPSSTG